MSRHLAMNRFLALLLVGAVTLLASCSRQEQKAGPNSQAPAPQGTTQPSEPAAPELQSRISLAVPDVTTWSVAFSADSTLLASAGSDKLIRLWDVPAGKEKAALKGHSGIGGATCVAFSRQGDVLASGAWDNTVRVWEVGTKTEKTKLEGHQDMVRALAFSPKGNVLASGSFDKSIKLWDLRLGRATATLDGHKNDVFSVAFHADGKVLASAGSNDGTIKLWDVEAAKHTRTIDKLTENVPGALGVMCVGFSPKGELLAAGVGGSITLLQMPEGKLERTLKHGEDGVTSVAFTPDGNVLASAAGNTIKLWDVNTGNLVAILKGHTDRVNCVAISGDGKTLASGSSRDDGTIRLWDMPSAK